MLLRIRNYFEHPVQRNYLVFQFYNLTMAEAFANILVENSIKFERDDEEGIPKKVLFGVHKTDSRKAMELNNFVIGKYRKPFIGNRYLKWTMLIVVTCAITVALIGYFRNA